MSWSMSSPCRDHPHVCGEHLFCCVCVLLWDHPRVCGEHYVLEVARIVRPGSSPRMRGTRQRTCEGACPFGIIPAYAGNTACSSDSCWRYWDHPRVCGEHTKTRSPVSTPKGSSPRMRGTHLGRFERVHGYGIIPAYAGNTLSMKFLQSYYGDHPRVCGEHTVRFVGSEVVAGSSPRMRGTPLHDAYIGGFMGIIPAYAGNTRHRPDGWRRPWDHPRVCGEHKVGKLVMPKLAGSSPRMRGTRF